MPVITQKITSNWMAISQLEGSKKQKAHDCNHGLPNLNPPTKVRGETLHMADYITAITGLINMASGLSNGMLVYILIFALLCILTWKLPELIKALRKDDDDD
jgi:hypothetical protein